MLAPVRVLLVTQEYPPETHWGGIGTYAGIIAPALVRRGAEVHVLSVVRGQPATDRAGSDGVVVHRRPLRRPRGVGRLTRLPETWGRVSLGWSVARNVAALDWRPDVVECASWMAEGSFLARRRDAPLLVSVFSAASEILPLLGPMRLDIRLAIRVEDSVIRRADLVIGPPSQVGKVTDRLGLPATTTQPIPCPVAVTPEAPALDGPPTICFVGRFEPRKGPDVVVRAMPDVLAALPQARLVLRGRDAADVDHPSYAAWLRRLAADLGVADAVSIVERWNGHEEVTAAMAAATVCVVPSRWESFGYVAAEASALGRAVVASDIPALAEVVADGETGRLARVDDPRAWSEAILAVLCTPGRAQAMGEAGRRRMRREFDPDEVATQTLSAYQRATERFAGRRHRG